MFSTNRVKTACFILLVILVLLLVYASATNRKSGGVEGKYRGGNGDGNGNGDEDEYDTRFTAKEKWEIDERFIRAQAQKFKEQEDLRKALKASNNGPDDEDITKYLE